MLGKKLINAGPVGSSGPTPSNYFNTVLYTGNGGTQRIGGYINRGAVFNGSSSYITASGLGVTGNSTFSTSTWIKTTSTGLFFFFGDGTLNSSFYISVETGGNVRVGNFGTDLFTSSASVNNGNWHHVAFTSDGTTSKLYINGSESNSTSHTWAISADVIELGRGTTSYYFNGSIDQVRIFDKALSSSEVTTLYGETHASTTISTTDIFDDNSGVALYQLDGNANDTGGVSGYIGEGAIFNGSSSKIDLPNFMPSGNASRSVSMWINTTQTTAATLLQYGGGNTNLLFNLRINDGGAGGGANTIGIGFYANDFNRPATGLMDGDWHHIAATYDGTNAKIYIDGVQTGADFATGGVNTTASSGLIGSNGGSFIFNGKIDQVRIYDKALSSSEVTTLYGETASSNITISDLVAYYPMEGTSLDQEGSYNGTDTNVKYNYSGTASNVTYQDATNFSPDLVWIKQRSGTASHSLQDTVRGAGQNYNLYSDNTAYEGQYGIYGYLSSFDTNGFTVEAGSGSHTNANGSTYAAWCFNAGTDTAASNTDGSITSTVKANQDAGFSIVKWNSSSTASDTIGSGLNERVEFLLTKKLNGSRDWHVWHKDLPNNGYLNLNSNIGEATPNGNRATVTNNNTFIAESTSGDSMIAYCFHSVDGIQKVGSYQGNGSTNGTIVEIGFEPAFIMTKGVDGDRWLIADNKRHEAINNNAFLDPSDSHVESSFGSGNGVTFLSNGFQLKSNDNVLNGTNKEYLYLAIAADPDTTTPTVEDSFEVVTYTGNAAARTIDYGFKPDLWIVKNRANGYGHWWTWQDSVRGTRSLLHSNSSNAAGQWAGDYIDFTENGVDITYTGTNTNGINENNFTFVSYAFKAGDHDDNLPQINTEGTIDSIVSVNDAAGFSIVKWTGDGNDATVGHGLSSQPELVITKGTANLATYNSWITYHKDLSTNHHLYLNTTDSEQNGVGDYFRDAAFSSTVIGLGNDIYGPNVSGTTMIAYCFTSITGYQKIGTYTSAYPSTTSVNVGFQPRFVMIKSYNQSRNWVIHDSARTDDKQLYPNLSSTEADTGTQLQFTSTGFDVSGGSNDLDGGSSYSYIYLAIK